ncbi:MAG: hypothetical protein HW421_1738 [Ignavibacteria bacterium]|nr:hypothetical protein [Ignavibacteria bacterium]
MNCLIKKFSMFALVLAFALTASLNGQSINRIKPDKDVNIVRLPTQQDNNLSKFLGTEKSDKAEQWSEFSKKNGKWSIAIDPITKTPRIAMGESIQIEGFELITNDNVEQAAISFLRDNQKLFNIDVKQLKLSRKDETQGKWYVTFKQYYEGIEVLLSNINLRIFENGKVMAFDIEYYNNITVKTTPDISYSSAVNAACKGITKNSNVNSPLSAQTKYILPIKSSLGVSYSLVYKVKVNASTKHAKYITYVNAKDGKVLWRYNTTMKAELFDTKGTVKMNGPLSPVEEKPFSDLMITVGDQTYTSNENGKFNIDVNKSTAVNAKLEGPYCKIITNGRQPANFDGSLEPSNTFTVFWNDNNSHRYERIQFFHTNYIHDFMKKLDPNMTCLDKQVQVLIGFQPENGDSLPNAFSNGDTIMFLNCQNDSFRLADGPGVLYHEYGHSINTLFYAEKGIADGMANSACQEGIADVTAAMMLDEPRVGVGVFLEDTTKFIRTCKNDLIYPDSVIGESHIDGQILSGAFWDLRELTSLEVLRKLHHYARYGLPDDPNDGIAFYKWFSEVIIADDDDGNLGNGTPHLKEIVQAFNKHQIGTALYFRNNFQHIPLKDTKNTTKPYKVEFSFGQQLSLFAAPDSVSLVYQVKMNGTESNPVSIPAIKVSGSQNFTAEIPPQPKGADILYYMTCIDSTTKKILKFGPNNGTTPYEFTIGVSTALLDDFEKESGWTVGSDVDNTTAGEWERGKPNKMDFFMFGTLKPGDDHSSIGDTCFSTGLGTLGDDIFQAIFENCPNGKTTLTSPAYDLTKLEEAIFKYYQFFVQLPSMTDSNSIPLPYYTEISNNNGKNWHTVRIDTSMGASEWVRIKFRFADYLPVTKQCRIRFRYEGALGQFGFPGTITSITVDDFEIQTSNDVVISKVPETTSSSTSASHPNPFSDLIYISCPEKSSTTAVLKITDLFGQEIYSSYRFNNIDDNITFTWNGMTSDNSMSVPGMYYYTITTGNSIYSGKIVKQ